MSDTQIQINKNSEGVQEATLVSGSIWRSIWIMSWPLLITTIASSLVGLVDVKVAMKLGPASQAAVGIAEHVVFLFMIFAISTGVGTTAMVSRAFGANDVKLAMHATAQSINLALSLGISLSLICLAIATPALKLFAPGDEVYGLAVSYVLIFAFVLIPFSLETIVCAAFRAAGNARIPLVIIGTTTVINILGDYLTVYRNWPISNLGIKGIAFSGLIATFCGAFFAIYFLKHSNLEDSLKHLWPFSLNTIVRVLKIGLPSALQRLAWGLSIFILIFILKLCPDPTAALASLTIGIRVEGLLFMPLLAFSLAISSIVGQNLGAKKFERAYKAGWHITSVGVSLMVLLGLGMFVLAEPLANGMSNDPDTVSYTAAYLRIAAISEPMLALGMILGGALQGAGDTRTPMWITIVTQWMVRLPLAWFLALNLKLGPRGAWIGMTISIFFMALLMVWRYRSKDWMTVKV